MNNLLSIEENFLTISTVKSACGLVEYKKVNTQLVGAKKKLIFSSLAQGKIISAGREWFMSQQGKEMMKAAGIIWNLEEFFYKVYGLKKNQAHRLIKAANLPEETVNEFLATREQGDSASIEALIEFAKEGELESGEGEATERVQTILTLSWKTEQGNVALRVDSSGKVTTKNQRADIANAIAFLQSQIDNITESPVK